MQSKEIMIDVEYIRWETLTLSGNNMFTHWDYSQYETFIKKGVTLNYNH
ncbi:hypothetical protein [Chryseobacterium sp. T16E-39]|nr:hypothetical protein [Chryseobacterium sp. T16E-39]